MRTCNLLCVPPYTTYKQPTTHVIMTSLKKLSVICMRRIGLDMEKKAARPSNTFELKRYRLHNRCRRPLPSGSSLLSSIWSPFQHRDRNSSAPACSLWRWKLRKADTLAWIALKTREQRFWFEWKLLSSIRRIKIMFVCSKILLLALHDHKHCAAATEPFGGKFCVAATEPLDSWQLQDVCTWLTFKALEVRF